MNLKIILTDSLCKLVGWRSQSAFGIKMEPQLRYKIAKLKKKGFYTEDNRYIITGLKVILKSDCPCQLVGWRSQSAIRERIKTLKPGLIFIPTYVKF